MREGNKIWDIYPVLIMFIFTLQDVVSLRSPGQHKDNNCAHSSSFPASTSSYSPTPTSSLISGSELCDNFLQNEWFSLAPSTAVDNLKSNAVKVASTAVAATAFAAKVQPNFQEIVIN